MANTVEIVIQAKDNASAPIKGVGSALGELETRSSSAGGVLGTLGNVAQTALGFIGGQVVIAGVQKLGEGLVGVVSGAANFQSAMSGVGAVAGASSDQLAALSAKALQLGMDTTLAGVNATDAATAMEQLASGGVSVADIMGGAAYGALQLASAGGIDVGQAASIAALALKDFGLAGSDLPHVADLFAAAANTSAVTVTDLGNSLQYVGPIAATMGISIEQLTGTLAELGDKGIKGSEAGTALRGMITNLSAPTLQQTGVMKDLNLQFFDSSGKMKDLAGVAQELHDKLGGLTDQQRTAALATLFGNEGLTAAQILYDGGAAAVDDYTNKVNVAGSAAANGQLRNDNLKGSLAALGGVWETLTISVGTAFIPVIRGATDGLTAFATNLMPLVTAALPGLVSGLTSVVGAAVRFGTDVVGAVMAVVGAFQALFSGQINFGQFVGGMETFVGTILGNLGQLAARALPYLQSFLGSIGSFIASAAPQIAAQALIWGQAFVGWVAASLPGVLGALGGWASALMGWITGTAVPAVANAVLALATATSAWISTTAIPLLTTTLPAWGAALWGWITGTAVPALTSAVSGLGAVLGNWVGTTAIPAIEAALPQWVTAVISGVQAAIPGIQQAAQTITTTLGGAFGQVAPQAQALGSAIQAAIPVLEQFGQAVLAGIGGALQAIMPLVQGFIGTFQSQMPQIEALGTQLGAAWDALVPILKAVAEVVGGALVVAWGVMLATLGGVLGALSGELPGAIQVAQGALQIITGSLQFFGSLIGGIISVVVDLLHGDWAGAWQDAQSTVVNVADAIKTTLSGALNVVEGLFSGSIGAILGFVSGFASTLLGYFQGIYNSLTGSTTDFAALISGAWNTLVSTNEAVIGSFVTSVIGFFSNMSGAVGSAIGTLVGVVETGFGGMVSAATTAIDNLVSAVSTGIGNAVAAVGNAVGQLPGVVLGVGGALYSAGASIIGMLESGIESAIGGAIQKVKDGLSQIANLLPHSEPKDPTSPLRGLSDSGKSIFTMLGEGIAAGTPAAAKAAADAATAVAKAITDNLTAIKLLGQFDPASAPSDDQLGGFASAVSGIIASIVNTAAAFSDKALAAASSFSDAAGKVFGFFANALAAMKGLPEQAVPTFVQVQTFATSVGMIVQELQWVASAFTADGLTQAGTFADAAGKILGVVTNGLAAIKALAAGEIKDVPFAAVQSFATSVGMIVQELGWVATYFKEQALAQTTLFADTAGKVLGIVTGGIAAILALPNVTDPGFPAIHLFATIVATIVQEMENAASFFKDQGLAAASAFATAGGTILGIIGNSVAGIMSLNTLVEPSKTAIDNFLVVVFYIVGRFAEAATRLSTEGIAATTAFSNAAQAALAATKEGTDAFKGFEKLVVPSKQAIDNLVIGIDYVVQQIGVMAGQMTDQGIARTNAFATMTSNVVKGITDTLDLFKKIMEAPYKTMLADGMKVVTDQMNIALGDMQALSNDSSRFLSLANNFADNMRQAAGAIRDGLASAAAAGGASLPGIPSGGGGGGGSLGPIKEGRASGGPVTAGTAYVVGEQGPEVFVPGTGGAIIPNGALGGGGGGDIIVHIHAGTIASPQQVVDFVYQGLLAKKRNNTALGLA